MRGVDRNRTGDRAFAELSLTTWLRRHYARILNKSLK